MIIQIFARGYYVIFFICYLLMYTGDVQAWEAVSRSANLAITSNEVWSLYPLKRCATIPFRKKATCPATQSKNGRLVAYGLIDSTIEIYETRTGRLWKRLGKPQLAYGDKFEVTSVSFAPNGKLLATGNQTGLFVWRVRDGKLLFSLPVPKEISNTGLIEFAPCSTMLALAGGYNDEASINLFDVKRRKFIKRYLLENHDGRTLNMKFSPDGLYLVATNIATISAANWDSIVMFNVKSGNVRWKRDNRSFKAGEYATSNFFNLATWSRDGRRVAVGNSGQLQILNARNGKLLLRRIFVTGRRHERSPTLRQQMYFHPQLNVR